MGGLGDVCPSVFFKSFVLFFGSFIVILFPSLSCFISSITVVMDYSSVSQCEKTP